MIRWLAPEFSSWNLDDVLPLVRCPALAIHGGNDEFGSARHPKRLAAAVQGPVTMRLLENCGHVPHREVPNVVLDAVHEFLLAEK